MSKNIINNLDSLEPAKKKTGGGVVDLRVVKKKPRKAALPEKDIAALVEVEPWIRKPVQEKVKLLERLKAKLLTLLIIITVFSLPAIGICIALSVSIYYVLFGWCLIVLGYITVYVLALVGKEIIKIAKLTLRTISQRALMFSRRTTIKSKALFKKPSGLMKPMIQITKTQYKRIILNVIIMVIVLGVVVGIVRWQREPQIAGVEELTREDVPVVLVDCLVESFTKVIERGEQITFNVWRQSTLGNITYGIKHGATPFGIKANLGEATDDYVPVTISANQSAQAASYNLVLVYGEAGQSKPRYCQYNLIVKP